MIAGRIVGRRYQVYKGEKNKITIQEELDDSEGTIIKISVGEANKTFNVSQGKTLKNLNLAISGQLIDE